MCLARTAVVLVGLLALVACVKGGEATSIHGDATGGEGGVIDINVEVDSAVTGTGTSITKQDPEKDETAKKQDTIQQ